MYRGYEINLTSTSGIFTTIGRNILPSKSFSEYLSYGNLKYTQQRKAIRDRLASFIRETGHIDGGKLVDEWFPAIDCKVFLSHSHDDEKLAIAFAQWLYENFGLTTFIDSTVWGYSTDLLKEIDKAYCWQPDIGAYNYNLRNRTTAFVNMLLASSLSQMIGKCECLMFLNTPNSIISNPNQQETSSPWIFYELLQSQLIGKVKKRLGYFAKTDPIITEGLESFKVALPVKTSHLTKLHATFLQNWKAACKEQTGYEALDILYNLAPESSP